jgi:outer membrane biogenesis lipoprotein LolB
MKKKRYLILIAFLATIFLTACSNSTSNQGTSSQNTRTTKKALNHINSNIIFPWWQFILSCRGTYGRGRCY